MLTPSLPPSPPLSLGAVPASALDKQAGGGGGGGTGLGEEEDVGERKRGRGDESEEEDDRRRASPSPRHRVGRPRTLAVRCAELREGGRVCSTT
eukprot:1715510-Rhodomonas_salina.2